MPQFSDLPTEILIQIMCECEDIATTLHLASTCIRMQEMWQSNAKHVTCAVFTFTYSEMVEYLVLAELEEPYKHSGSALNQYAHTNILVRYHLGWLRKSASAILAIRDHYVSFVVTRFNQSLESLRLPDYHREYLTLRQLVTGYDHLSTLSAAFVEIRTMSTDQVEDAWSVGTALEDYIRLYGSHFGIEKEEDGRAYWESDGMPSDNYLPDKWAFAVYALWMEASWRPDDTAWIWTPGELTHEHDYEAARRWFGRDRMVAMFGEDKLPYTEARVALLEKCRREHANDPRCQQANHPQIIPP